MPDPLKFSLVPLDDRVTFDSLRCTIDSVRKLIFDVDSVVMRRSPRARARRWYIAGFHSSNPTIELEPAEDGMATVDAVVRGIQRITESELTAPPPFFSMRELEDLQDMRRLFRDHGLARLEIGSGNGLSTKITSQIDEQVERIMTGGYAALGSLEGQLEAINVRHTPQITIWESISGSPIRCSFSREQLDQVKNLLTHRVHVSGMIQYFTDGRPKSITRTPTIVAATPDEDLPKAGYGSVPELTDGRDSTELLDGLRGEPSVG